MAGVPIPLVAVQHQLVWTDPITELAGETREVVHPILRHQDHAIYSVTARITMALATTTTSRSSPRATYGLPGTT